MPEFRFMGQALQIWGATDELFRFCAVMVTSLFAGFFFLDAFAGFISASDLKYLSTTLTTIALVFCPIYALASAIELFGTIALFTRRLALIRLFTFAQAGVTLVIVSLGFIRVVLHFPLKDEMMRACKDGAVQQSVDFHFDIWGSRLEETLSPDEANDWCNDSYKRDLASDILAFVFYAVTLWRFTSAIWRYTSRLLKRHEVALQAALEPAPEPAPVALEAPRQP